MLKGTEKTGSEIKGTIALGWSIAFAIVLGLDAYFGLEKIDGLGSNVTVPVAIACVMGILIFGYLWRREVSKQNNVTN